MTETRSITPSPLDVRQKPSGGSLRRYGLLQTLGHFFPEREASVRARERRARVLSRMLDEVKSLGHPAPTMVQKRPDLSLKDFREQYQDPAVPVVLQGAARHFPACQNWTLERITRECGADLIPIDHRFARLDQLVDAVRKGERSYLRFYSLVQRHPEFLYDLDLPWLLGRRNRGWCIDQGFQTFIGNSKARPTPLHNANDANLFVQVAGRKHWVLYDPRFTFAIDPPKVRGEYRAQRSGSPSFDPFAPDYERFPVFRHLPRWEVVLDPGDVLWNPPYMWHAVRNLDDPTIGIGYRWVCPRHCFRVSPLFATLDCLASDPPIWRSIAMADRDFSLVFLEQFPALKRHPSYSIYAQQVESSYARYREIMRAAARGGVA